MPIARFKRPFAAAIAAMLTLGLPAAARAGELREGGRLLLTNGITTVEGATGGGIASWALISGRETKDGIGGTVYYSHVPLSDFQLQSFGASVGLFDRLELSVARQRFDTRDAGAALGLGKGFAFGQMIYGAKLRLAGDAVWDQDRWLPQVSAGVQYKVAEKAPILSFVGAKAHTGADFYVAATKVVLSQGLVLNATLRLTRANQLGLLGFGGDGEASRTAQFEGSIGKLITPSLIVGGEVRTRPDNLRFAREQRAYDLFVAWAVQRHVTLTAAYVDLGDIATFKHQQGAFLSVQGAY